MKLTAIRRVEALENYSGRTKAYAVLCNDGIEHIISHIQLKEACKRLSIKINDITDRPNEFITVFKSAFVV